MKKRLILLLCLLIFSALAVAGVGAYLKYELLGPMGYFQEESILAVPFLLMDDRGAQYALQHRNDAQETEPPTLAPAETTMPPETIPETTIPETTIPETTIPTTVPVETVPETTAPPETTVPPTEPISYTVEASWFDDALFLGDSRLVGLREYGELGDAHYFCDVGLTVYAATDSWLYVRDYGYVSMRTLFEKNTFGKVFLEIGINECGVNNANVAAQYQEIVDLIQECQPDAKIILMSVMTVSSKKAEDPRFTLEQIADLNARIKAIADKEELYYLDINLWAMDADGYLREEIRYDGVHPSAQGYKEWGQWMLDNVGMLGIE